MKRTLAVLLTVASCGGANSDEAGGGGFNEQAAIEVLRPGWPSLDDEGLAEKAGVFREACESATVDRTGEVGFALLLQTPASRRVVEAGCPDVVAMFDD